MTGRDLRLHRWSIDADRDSTTPWTSPWTSPVASADGFTVVSLLPSWAVDAPAGTAVDVEVRRGTDDPWIALARWTTDADRTSYGHDDHGEARRHDDELVIDADAGWTSGQVRLVPHASPDGRRPSLRSASLLLSGTPAPPGPPSPPSGEAVAVDLPAYSQQRHRDLADAVAGGGANWCSPTAVTMLLDHWGAAPDGSPPGGDLVPVAAAAVHDVGYGGTGNWSFNTAWAATLGLDACVTRLRSLAEAEAFVRAGVPLVVSVVFTTDQLDGAGFDTDGHLVVLRGFDAAGDVLVHDPASQGRPDDAAVPRTYRRDQLHAAWLERSSGVAYVLRPPHVPLPEPPEQPNW